jgi:hypothetical protein
MSFLKAARVGAALLAIGLPLPAAAQDCAVGIKPPAAGSWSEYTTKDGKMRLALLGTETRAGRNLVRMEISMSSREGPMIMQVFAPGYPYQMSGIEDFVIKAAGQPAMRMSAQMLQMMANRMPKDLIAEFCRNASMNRVGEESITVPAGTFRTIHYHDATSGNDVWVSESIPFGLVRTKLKNGEEIELTSRGTDARSQITETPQEMGMPGRQ